MFLQSLMMNDVMTQLFIGSIKTDREFSERLQRPSLMTSKKNGSQSCRDEGKKVKKSNLLNKAETLIMGTFYKIDPDL